MPEDLIITNWKGGQNDTGLPTELERRGCPRRNVEFFNAALGSVGWL
jgi:hypothetical protein